MANIMVNHKKLLDAADKIDAYITRLDKNMLAIDGTMVSLNGQWKGDDYKQVASEWNEIYSADSTSGRMKTSLKTYAGSLRESAKLYKEAQARAINRANTLCK